MRVQLNKEGNIPFDWEKFVKSKFGIYIPEKYVEEGQLSICYRCKCCDSEMYGRWVYHSYDKFGYINDRGSDFQRLRKSDTSVDQTMCEQNETILNPLRQEVISILGLTHCPICGAELGTKEEGNFRLGRQGSLALDDEWKSFSIPEKCFTYDSNLDEIYKWLSYGRVHEENDGSKDMAAKFSQACDVYMPNVVLKTPLDNDAIKKYILHLIHLENNIYSLTRQLRELYKQQIRNDRVVVLSKHEPSYIVKAEIDNLRSAYHNAKEAVKKMEACPPDVSINYPTEPTAPVLGTPGLFNKKKVLEENEALTAKYQAEMESYRKEVQRCEEEKSRLIAEVLAEAQAKADAAKAALDEAERVMDDKIKALEARPVPAKAVKEILDKEIAEAEELLKKTYAARNELYACDVIFGKYRNNVALSSFYEYLMSGRCSSLEGADGAYNIYENEIRANRVIAQLDTVISSLEDIKANQYMMYQEMLNINASLQQLNQTMDEALTSIQNMEISVANISENTAVIAHNTAVTAYYSKVNAELTNALGYMVAFK